MLDDADALTFAVATGIWRILGIEPGEQAPERPSPPRLEELRRFLAHELRRAANSLFFVRRDNEYERGWREQNWNVSCVTYMLLEARFMAEGVDKAFYEGIAALTKPELPSQLPLRDVTPWSTLINALVMMTSALEDDDWKCFGELATSFCGAVHAHCIYRQMELPDLANYIRRVLRIRGGETCSRPAEPVLDFLGFVLANQIVVRERARLESARLEREAREVVALAARRAAVHEFLTSETSTTPRDWGVAPDVAPEKSDAPSRKSEILVLWEALERLKSAKYGSTSDWSEFTIYLAALDASPENRYIMLVC